MGEFARRQKGGLKVNRRVIQIHRPARPRSGPPISVTPGSKGEGKLSSVQLRDLTLQRDGRKDLSHEKEGDYEPRCKIRGRKRFTPGLEEKPIGHIIGTSKAILTHAFDATPGVIQGDLRDRVDILGTTAIRRCCQAVVAVHSGQGKKRCESDLPKEKMMVAVWEQTGQNKTSSGPCCAIWLIHTGGSANEARSEGGDLIFIQRRRAGRSSAAKSNHCAG